MLSSHIHAEFAGELQNLLFIHPRAAETREIPRPISKALLFLSCIITRLALVASLGAILSYIMCRGMNCSIFSVILGGFGTEGGAVAARGQAQDTSATGYQVRGTVGPRGELAIAIGRTAHCGRIPATRDKGQRQDRRYRHDPRPPAQ